MSPPPVQTSTALCGTPLHHSANAAEKSDSPGLLFVRCSEVQALKQSYLPFCRHGGIFVPTRRPYTLRQRLCLVLRLPQMPDAVAVAVTVVWLGPAHGQLGQSQGIGLHFDKSAATVNEHIVRLLGESR